MTHPCRSAADFLQRPRRESRRERVLSEGFARILAVHGSEFDEESFFRACAKVRALLIGRRALIVLGAPVFTADYDIWLDSDDIERFNASVVELDLYPNHPPEVARARGRYVLENDQHVDVLVARGASTKDGEQLTFDGAWERRQTVPHSAGLAVALPSFDDLISTKKWSMRSRDVDDIELLKAIEKSRGAK
jgi:hypothetical protein